MPPVDELLEDLDHPLLDKVNQQFADPTTPHDRIRAIDDNVLFKVRLQRWQGAVWPDDPRIWLVAAGKREAGSPDDFYAALTSATVSARKSYNAEQARPLKTNTFSGYLLPSPSDEMRYRAEIGARFLRQLSGTVHDLLRASLLDGGEHIAGLGSFRLGIQVRADDGHETYVAVRITGSVTAHLVMLIFDYVPGCAHDGWYPEDAMPERALLPGEYAWSNLMDPAEAAKFLDVVQT